MCDFSDDFDDDYDESMDDDSFEDSLEGEMDEPFADEPDHEDEPDKAESQDDDLTGNPFILGGAMGFAYEEGLREGKRRKQKRFNDNDSD